MKFTTETSSMYEVDTERKRVRRLIGAGNPTPRIGKDGEWKRYKHIEVKLRQKAIIVWPDGTPLMEGTPERGYSAGTQTSVVVSIDRGGNAE